MNDKHKLVSRTFEDFLEKNVKIPKELQMLLCSICKRLSQLHLGIWLGQETVTNIEQLLLNHNGRFHPDEKIDGSLGCRVCPEEFPIRQKQKWLEHLSGHFINNLQVVKHVKKENDDGGKTRCCYCNVRLEDSEMARHRHSGWMWASASSNLSIILLDLSKQYLS